MPVEIERASVSFTEEAQRALQAALLRVERRVRAKAADHAIKSRGTPSEVTGSDIEKAYRELIGSRSRDAFSARPEVERSLRRRTISLRFISTVYMWFGVLVATGGALYPFIRTKLADPSTRLGVLIGLCGLLVAALGASLRAYLGYREGLRKEEKWKQELSTVFDIYRKPE